MNGYALDDPDGTVEVVMKYADKKDSLLPEITLDTQAPMVHTGKDSFGFDAV